MRRHRTLPLAGHSFLRRVDPRAKLALAATASAAVMLPLAPLAVLGGCAALLITAAGLLQHVGAALRRIAPWVAVLFVLDLFFVGIGFAALITVRLIVLVAASSLLFATTTADELRQALERLHVPQRFAFTLGIAYRSLGLLESEWRSVIEAQQARGILPATTGGRPVQWRQRLRHASCIVVPAIVLVTQRAWSIHEAAATRGFESPRRRPATLAHFSWFDHALVAAALFILVAIAVWR